MLFGHLGIVSRNKILCFCAEGVNDILPAPGILLQPGLGKGSLFPAGSSAPTWAVWD